MSLDAPDARIIIVAPTKQAGRDRAAALGITPTAIVTPRSPHAAHGITADKVYIDRGVVETEQLMAAVVPCMATSRDGEIIRA